MGDIDPAKYSGEGWYATDEYAKPSDIKNPYTRADIPMSGEDYYPPPDVKRRK
jgi:hypothetical protein